MHRILRNGLGWLALAPILTVGCARVRLEKIEGSAAAAEARSEPRVFRDAQGGELKYRFVAPRDAKTSRRYPLVLFLHGAGERGADNKAQCKHGLPEATSDGVMKAYPCYIIAPQCPADEWWTDRQFLRQDGSSPEPARWLRMAIELVQQTAKQYPVDPERIYITGLSMGGYGTWDAIWRWPELFAAAAPICGGGDPARAAVFVKLPIWVFHGGADKTVPVERSRVMVEALRKAGGQPRYTEYPGVGHDSWTASYRDPAFWAWLFAQHR